jgi:hypothetical protein
VHSETHRITCMSSGGKPDLGSAGAERGGRGDGGGETDAGLGSGL